MFLRSYGLAEVEARKCSGNNYRRVLGVLLQV